MGYRSLPTSFSYHSLLNQHEWLGKAVCQWAALLSHGMFQRNWERTLMGKALHGCDCLPLLIETFTSQLPNLHRGSHSGSYQKYLKSLFSSLFTRTTESRVSKPLNAPSPFKISMKMHVLVLRFIWNCFCRVKELPFYGSPRTASFPPHLWGIRQ